MVTGPLRRVHNRRVPGRILRGVVVLFLLAAVPRAWQPAVEAGITGRVVSHDGSPVTSGSVTLLASSTSHADAAIDRRGEFKVVPAGTGPQRLFISAPGHAPYRAFVTVPASRAMAMPDITLAKPTYFRARFVTSEGEPMAASGVRRRFLNIDGASIPDPLGHVREQAEEDGSITIGPLPPGRTLLAFDRQPFAQTRLRDVNVTGKDRLVDAGTIPIAPGARHQIEVVDGAGRPVASHEVWLEDAVQPSLLSFPAAKTDADGRATFERLAPGRYRVFTQTRERCGNMRLTVSRVIVTGGSEASRTRIVLGGRAMIRIASAMGPMFGRTVSAAPDAPPQAPWQMRYADLAPRPRWQPAPAAAPPSCSGVTDNDGRVTLAPFPPGPVQVRVGLFNSRFVIRATVPEEPLEITITIPDGLVPVRVSNRITQQPITAEVAWLGGGRRVEAATTANGDALLEGVGAAGGTLTISANGYQTLEGNFPETPETQQDVALIPLPAERLSVRVIDDAGNGVANAIVQLLPRGPGDAPEFAAADSSGVATFMNLPAGTLQFSAHANGFKTAVLRVAEESRASITMTLTRSQ